MLVPAPVVADASPALGFIAKYDQTSIWKTKRSETKYYLPTMTTIACVALLVEATEEGAHGSWPGQKGPSRCKVECRRSQ